MSSIPDDGSTDSRPYTAIATIAFGNEHRKLYFQDNDGWVRELCWEGNWTGDNTGSRLFKAKQNTPLAAIICGSSPTQIHVYYVDENDILQEYCCEMSYWFCGVLGKSNVKVSPNSKLGACTWNGYPRVYYQQAGSTTLREYGWDGKGWFQGMAFKVDDAIDGSSIAAVAPRGGAGVRVYYQSPDWWIREFCWDGQWVRGHVLAQAPSGSAIGAVTWGSDPQIRVYFQAFRGGIVENVFSGGWNSPRLITDAFPDTNLSVCSWGSIHIRIYYQKNPRTIQEYCWDAEWTSGATVLSV
ncbi:fucose-specific lectin [Kalaharituber pfeilii]|nr:fucose-specific lectin [Kalaharituber pfeilii]